MNISNPFHNSFYTLTSNNIEDEITLDIRLTSLIMLASKKERYLHINPVLYKCPSSESSLLDELTPSQWEVRLKVK